MLALTIPEGGFLVVGETIVRVVEIRGSVVRLAIDTLASNAVMRFDARGNQVTYESKVVEAGAVLHSHGRNMRGVELACGHKAWADEAIAVGDAMTCPACAGVAARHRERILELIAKAATRTRDGFQNVGPRQVAGA